MRKPLMAVVTFAMLAVMLCAGCSSGNPGLYAAPVFLPQIETVALPEGPLVAATPAEFAVTWLHGREPFTVTWNFGAGADPTIISTTATERTHTVYVTLVNETDQPELHSGGVTVQDFAGESSSATFSYTVEPAP